MYDSASTCNWSSRKTFEPVFHIPSTIAAPATTANENVERQEACKQAGGEIEGVGSRLHNHRNKFRSTQDAPAQTADIADDVAAKFFFRIP